MDTMTLKEILESDREHVLAGLEKDRSPAAAQAVLEKELERIMYRYGEQCPDAAQREASQYLLQTLKNALPLLGAVGEAREWQRTAAEAEAKKKLRPAALGLLLAGLLLLLAAVLALHFSSGRVIAPLSLLKVLLPVLLGAAGLFWAGVLAARPPKARRRAERAPQTRTEFLVDVPKLWHDLQGMLLLADGALASVREAAAARRQEQASENALSERELELFAGLLETAYAQRGTAQDADMREIVSGIRFYLHGAGVEAMDYEQGREGWFEFLPAREPGTLCPALVSGGKLLKKGLASARER